MKEEGTKKNLKLVIYAKILYLDSLPNPNKSNSLRAIAEDIHILSILCTWIDRKNGKWINDKSSQMCVLQNVTSCWICITSLIT